jgi:polar amino acid transport system substrate-binding protein
MVSSICRRLRIAISFVSLAIAGIALVGGTAAAETTLERAEKTGFVRIGFANEAPYGFATPQGELTGESPEIAKVILEKMGIKQVDGVLTPFRGLIPGLQARRFDIVAAGMFVTPARCEQVLFSEPTYAAGEGMLVPKGNPKNIHGFKDFLANRKLKLGLVAGGVWVRELPKLGMPESQISIYPDGPSGRAAVEAGRIDAWAMTGLAIQRLIDASAGAPVERAMPFEPLLIEGRDLSGYGAFAFRKEDQDFHAEFNRLLKEFVGTPEHMKLVRPLGFTEAELPKKTTAQLCAGT